jgi:hypothetical protein
MLLRPFTLSAFYLLASAVGPLLAAGDAQAEKAVALLDSHCF